MVPGYGAYAGLLVEGWHPSHPVGPPEGLEGYWVPRRWLTSCVVRSGCPWLMQRKFQQSKVYQFIDRLVVPVVSETGTHSAFSKTVKTPLVQFLDRLLTPGVQRQVQMAQTVQKTVELPQVQLLQCLVAFSRREQWRCLSFCSSSDAVNIQLCHRDRIHSASCAEVVVFHRAVLRSVVDAPVVLRQEHGFVSAETVEVAVH